MTVGDKEVLNSEWKREFESSKGNAKRAGGMKRHEYVTFAGEGGVWKG